MEEPHQGSNAWTLSGHLNWILCVNTGPGTSLPTWRCAQPRAQLYLTPLLALSTQQCVLRDILSGSNRCQLGLGMLWSSLPLFSWAKLSHQNLAVGFGSARKSLGGRWTELGAFICLLRLRAYSFAKSVLYFCLRCGKPNYHLNITHGLKIDHSILSYTLALPQLYLHNHLWEGSPRETALRVLETEVLAIRKIICLCQQRTPPSIHLLFFSVISYENKSQ